MTTTTATIAAALADMTARVIAALPTTHNAAGEPVKKLTKIVDGHRVIAKQIGWSDAEPVRFEIDWSTEPLDFAAAFSVLAA